MLTSTTKLLGEFYFRFRRAYHVTLPRVLYPRQGLLTNGHQRATWPASCWPPRRWATDHSTSGSQVLYCYLVEDEENFPVLRQFCA